MFSPRHCGPTLPDQVEGLPERFHPAATLELVEPEGREAELDAFFAAIPVNLRHQGCEAYYEPTADRVTMPSTSLFSGFDHYYATLAHELSHWTGHASRLGRDLKSRFGTAAYAAEELVALSGQSAPCLTHHRTVCSWHNAGGHQAG